MSQGFINRLVNLTKWEAVLRECLVEVSEVYTHPPFPIVLPHHYEIY